MAGNIRTTELGDSIATIVAAQALGYLKSNTVLARLVARDWDDEIATFGKVVDIPFTGALTVQDKGEGAAVTLQQPADTKVSVTLDKHKEISFLIEDYARALARPDYLGAYMADAMSKLAEDMDAELAALYAGLSQSIDATSTYDVTTWTEARRLLNVAHAPLAQRYAVIGPYTDKYTLGLDKATNAQYAQALGGVLADAYVGRFMGFNVYLDQNIKVASSEEKNLFFQRNAFVLATRPLPPAPANAGVIQKVMDEDGVGLRVTLSYNPAYLGVQCTVDVLYGVAELRDSHAVVVRGKAS